jgi:large subunit ribosomal protein L21
MYAIVEIKNSQYMVEKGDTILVDRLGEEDGKVIDFDSVLLTNDGKNISVGQPYVKGAKVKCKILGEEKGKKVIVFKFKRRKGYKKTKGHRQKYDKLIIESIEAGN